ncbi:hypothetical protein HAX54_031879 [Datura stramonium]|uniref:Uncharacterized protein n=1 Tax=Datura stramonium TaxID=4076 RepID=A0ABS8VAN3_DATST|nr:hypothetical protein [Datura stramonium]
MVKVRGGRRGRGVRKDDGVGREKIESGWNGDGGLSYWLRRCLYPGGSVMWCRRHEGERRGAARGLVIFRQTVRGKWERRRRLVKGEERKGKAREVRPKFMERMEGGDWGGVFQRAVAEINGGMAKGKGREKMGGGCFQGGKMKNSLGFGGGKVLKGKELGFIVSHWIFCNGRSRSQFAKWVGLPVNWVTWMGYGLELIE